MTREAQKLIFATGEIPTGANYSALIDQIPLIVALITDLPTAAAGNLGQVYCVGGINHKCTTPSTGVYEWTNMNAAATANDYANASNKPKINSELLSGDKTGDELKLLSNFSVLPAGGYPLALTSRLATDDDRDPTNSVQRTVQDLYDLFDVGNLPKYETYLNPLLTSNGMTVTWDITHTCKTKKVIIQLFDATSGILQTSSTLTGLIMANKNTVNVVWDSVSNVAANEYYVVLIG